MIDRAKTLLEDLPDSSRFTWEYKQRMLAAHIIKDGGLDNFLQWPESRESLHSGWTETAMAERRKIPDALLRFSKDPETGNPPDPKSPEGASGSYIRQLYVAYLIMSNMIPIDSIETIMEFGGGYGVLPVVMNRVGFTGDYYVYDFPIMHMIRDWYLDKQNIKTISVSDIDYMDSYDLIVGICSLDEAPESIRERFLTSKFSKNYFFMFHKIWDKQNMLDWIGDWFLSEGIAPKTIQPPNKNQFILYGSRK